MKMQTLALAFLAATAIGGLAWVFLYPILSGEKKAENRRASIARAERQELHAHERLERDDGDAARRHRIHQRLAQERRPRRDRDRVYGDAVHGDRKITRLNSSHYALSRMPSSA